MKQKPNKELLETASYYNSWLDKNQDIEDKNTSIDKLIEVCKNQEDRINVLEEILNKVVKWLEEDSYEWIPLAKPKINETEL